MRLEKIILSHFLTYEHLEYDFVNRPVMVQGRNLTEDKQKSNGSGKSGLQTGIEFCITASNSRGVNDAEIVTFGQKKGRAQLFVNCDVRKESLHIDWEIKVKGSNVLTLSKKTYGEEWEEVSFSNVNDGKKYILNWFAISKEDLFNYFIINKSRFKSFFKSSNKEKVDLINRFSDASILDGIEQIDNTELEDKYSSLERASYTLEGKLQLTKENLLKEQNRDFEAELLEESSDIDFEIESLQGDIAGYDDYIENWEKAILDSKDEVVSAQREIAETKLLEPTYLEDIKKEEEKLTFYNDKISKAKDFLKNHVSKDWTKERQSLESEIDSKNTLVNNEEKQISEKLAMEQKIAKALKEIDVTLSGSIECPKCSHEFILDGNIDELQEKAQKLSELNEKVIDAKLGFEKNVSEIKLSIKDFEKDISKINDNQRLENEAFNQLEKQVNEVVSQYNLVERKITKLKDRHKVEILDEIASIESEINEANAEIVSNKANIELSLGKIKNTQAEIENYKTQKSNLKKGSNESVIKGYKFEISVYEKDIESKKKELNEIGDKIYLRNKWITNFKQFKMHVANQSLEVMEYHTNRFLNEIGDDLTVKYDGYKVLSNGTIKEEITAKIIRETERTFHSFSGGEQGRLLFSSILANRYMINNTHPYGGLDFLSVDEVFEGIDSAGLKDLVNSAKQLEICVMLITHVTDEEIDEDVLVIEKVNGISRIAK